MKRVLEAWDTWTGRAMICFLGACLVLLSLFGGIALVAAQHVNVAQLCIEKGGTFLDKDDNRDLRDAKTGERTDDGRTTTESCTLPAKP